MTCMIVNVFMHDILGANCLDTTGAGYAEKAIYALLNAHPWFHDNATCDGVDFDKTNVAGGNLRNTIRDWIKKEKIKWGDTEAAGILNSRCKQWRQEGQGDMKKEEAKDMKANIRDTVNEVTRSIDDDRTEIRAKVDKRMTELEHANNSSGTGEAGLGKAARPPADAAATPQQPAGKTNERKHTYENAARM
ncbi:hypothetical protein AK88_05579 [Plasmodium fragile]|uniref:Schizont-infected cell agglutination extracellular alpha domain-containing protein n=1 Tax=Plasmodium fragile TaxID=5857 RepID=A0A0D9QD88_PLAFR|nr:uncharacterized protein AK88_05579 [Plasmodium fragile]KJP84787.1 hypothetical protein AK88_05579 [Plasmodium fragile]